MHKNVHKNEFYACRDLVINRIVFSSSMAAYATRTKRHFLSNTERHVSIFFMCRFRCRRNVLFLASRTLTLGITKHRCTRNAIIYEASRLGVPGMPVRVQASNKRRAVDRPTTFDHNKHALRCLKMEILRGKKILFWFMQIFKISFFGFYFFKRVLSYKIQRFVIFREKYITLTPLRCQWFGNLLALLCLVHALSLHSGVGYLSLYLHSGVASKLSDTLETFRSV